MAIRRIRSMAARLAIGGPALGLVLVLFGLSNAVAGYRFGDWQPNRWWIDLGGVGLPGWMVLVYLLMMLPWCLGAMMSGRSGRGQGGLSGDEGEGGVGAGNPARVGVRRVWGGVGAMVRAIGSRVRQIGLMVTQRSQARVFRVLAGLGVLGLLVGALANTAEVLLLWQRGGIEVRSGLIFSMLVVVWLVWIALGFLPSREVMEMRSAVVFRRWLAVGAVLVLMVGFPLGQAFSLGKTDYRRPAAFAVVLGARAYADGRVSDALYDRVMTGVELYHAGLVEALVFSGGPINGVEPKKGVRNQFCPETRKGVGSLFLPPEKGVRNHYLTVSSAAAYGSPADGCTPGVRPETVPDTFCLGAADRGRATETVPDTFDSGGAETVPDTFMAGAGVRVDEPMDEPRAMRRLAMAHGVPGEAIILDHGGWNTRLTANHVARLAKERGLGDYRVIAVSHDFHLPRIRVAFEQAGIRVLTVPARERYMLTQKPMLFAREVPAFWAYWWGRRGS